MTTSRSAIVVPIAASLLIAMSACSSEVDPSDDGSTGSQQNSEATTDDQQSAGDNASAGDASGSASSTAADQGASSDSGTPAPASGTTKAALTAIDKAEADTGGTAFEIDDQDDDGTWEVSVRTGDTAVEVNLSPDGTQVLNTENDDLDADDKAALDAASITLSDAIELAIEHVGGDLDDAELDSGDDGEGPHWEVSVDATDQGDVEVKVSIDGEILKVDD
ncbi:PepSY domain-containing protein [Cumulibacter soli]|uniref:PepSY domain-containing protein n=1 Tax=Cumulibacter soli TaxID=2546344 RepID=UPI00141A0E17|nr:PepSY domain-containing protein [Cumulibacter soli]